MSDDSDSDEEMRTSSMASKSKKQKVENNQSSSYNDDDDDDNNDAYDDGEYGAVSTMVVQFVSSEENEESGGENSKAKKYKLPQVDVPLEATTLQLEQLLNELLKSTNAADAPTGNVPYAFYVSTETTPVIETRSDNQGDGEQADGSSNKSVIKIRQEKEVTGSLKEAFESILSNQSTETTLRIRYQPLSLFKVHPVTRCTQDLPGHTEAILHVSFSPDGNDLASGGGDTTVRFWDLITNTPKHVCRGHSQHVLCTAWSPDGKRFASGDKAGEIRIWDPQTGKEATPKPFIGHKKWITSLSWEPMHSNPKCERFVSGSKDGTARVWNARTNRMEMALTHHTDSVECVQWGGEGFIYTASRDKTIIVWGAREDKGDSPFKIVRILTGHAHRINFIALSNGYICRTGNFDPANEYALQKMKKKGITPPTKTKEPEVEALERYQKYKKENGSDVPFERLVSCSDDYTLFLWYPTEKKQAVTRMTGHVQPVTHICFSPDGRIVASASFDKKVRLWDGRTGSFLAVLSGHIGHVYQVCWSADSRLIASASKDSSVKVWEARNPRKALHTLNGHADEVYALDWSPDGQFLASGSKDRILKIWRS